VPVPDLETRVAPAPHLLFHWAAFAALSTDRQVGMGIGPIPWTALDRYAERHGINDPDERERFERLIRAMDREFVKWHRGRK
jgi:hypothetical protein